jgi:hypothetical protein
VKAIFIVLAVVALGIYLLVRLQPSAPGAVTPTGAIEQPVADAVVARDTRGDGNARDSSRERVNQLALEIERALVAADPQQRETAFTYLLPELLHDDPGHVVQMVALQEPGETRDALRNEVTRQWITLDRAAALAWLQSLDNDTERRESATIAVRTLATRSPPEAIAVADQFGIGRDDGTVAHIFQIWEAEDPAAAKRWLESVPAGKRPIP